MSDGDKRDYEMKLNWIRSIPRKPH